jgi:hypothetical protein
MNNKVQRNQTVRFKILERLYNEESSNGIAEIRGTNFLAELNITSKEKDEAIEYLLDKGLIDDLGESSYSIARISTYGKDEYETAVNNPSKSSDYFPPIQNFYISQNSNSNIAIHSPGSTFNIEIISYTNLINQIENNLDKLNLSEDHYKIINDQLESLKDDIKNENKSSIGEKIKNLYYSFSLIKDVYPLILTYILPLFADYLPKDFLTNMP